MMKPLEDVVNLSIALNCCSKSRMIKNGFIVMNVNELWLRSNWNKDELKIFYTRSLLFAICEIVGTKLLRCHM